MDDMLPAKLESLVWVLSLVNKIIYKQNLKGSMRKILLEFERKKPIG